MTPTQLRALLAVVEHGTFRAAAEALGYTQSSVSQQVAALERDVGGRLLERPAGPVPPTLTAFGHVVVDHGRAVLERLDAARRAIDDFHHGRGRLVIGTFQAVTAALLPHLVAALLEEDPARVIELSEYETAAPVLDDVDLCFFDGPPAPGDHGIKLTSDAHVLLAPAGRFAPGPVPIAALGDVPVVALPRICTQAVVEDSLHHHGVDPHIVFRTADNNALAAMVAAGLGCAVLPRLSTRATAGIDVRELTPALPRREIYLHWNNEPSPLARRAIELARTCVSRLEASGDSGRAV